METERSSVEESLHAVVPRDFHKLLTVGKPKPGISGRRLLVTLKRNAAAIGLPLTPFREPDKPLFGSADFAEGVGNQAALVFEALYTAAEARGSRLETKASALLATAGIVTSVLVGVLAIARPEKVAAVGFAVSVALSMLALIGGLRALRVGDSEGLSYKVALDDAGREHADVQKRLALCWLWSALSNEARNDHTADLVRAAETLVVLASVSAAAGLVAMALHH